VTLDASGLNNPLAPYEMVKTMRASVLVLVRSPRAAAMQGFAAGRLRLGAVR